MAITLTNASVQRRANDVVLKWTPSEPIPDDDTVVLAAFLLTESGAFARQLGVKFIDGRFDRGFSFDHSGDRPGPMNVYHDVKLGAMDRTWTAVFPAAAIDGADVVRWSAHLSVGTYEAPAVTGTL